jgi:hypothetical protein
MGKVKSGKQGFNLHYSENLYFRLLMQVNPRLRAEESTPAGRPTWKNLYFNK